MPAWRSASAAASSSTIGCKRPIRQIFAIGECALHRGMIYGLVAPGYEMAEIVAANLTGGDRRFTGADLSTKLKLMGVDVASFGDYEAPPEQATPLVFEDPFAGVLQEAAVHARRHATAGRHPGRRRDRLRHARRCSPRAMRRCPASRTSCWSRASGSSGAAIGLDAMPDSAQVCSCNNVSKGAILRGDSRAAPTRSTHSSAAPKPAPAAAAACRW